MIYVVTVLKVIGIVLLVILALVLLLLFFPVSYEADVDLTERRGAGRIWWLFRLVRFRFLFDEETEAVLSVLFFRIDFLEERRREKRKERQKKRAEKRAEKREADERTTRQRVTDGAKTVVRVLGAMRDNAVLATAWQPLRKFLYRVRPRELSGRIAFGLSDPSQTGEIVGLIATFPVIYQTDLQIEPDFEAEGTYAEGEIHLKGRILLFWVLALAFGLIRQKNMRSFIGALRHTS